MEGKISASCGEISYSVVRERRRSISLKFQNAKLLVQIPRYSLVNVDRLLSEHMNWIVKHYLEISNSNDLLKEGFLLVGGKYVKVEFVQKEANSKVTRLDNQILVEAQDKYKATLALLKFSKKLTQQLVSPILDQRLEQMQRSISEVKFRRMKKWGYCTSDKKIRFNAYLSMMPSEIIDYVVSHEVAHLVEMNHSKRFWNVVGLMVKDYKMLRKELKRNNVNDSDFLERIRLESSFEQAV